VSTFGDEGEKLMKRNDSLSQGKMIAPFRVIVVEMNSNNPGSPTAQMLGVVDVT
jgi:hypothetical protein